MTNYERWLRYYQLGWISEIQLETAVSRGILTPVEKAGILAAVTTQ